MKSAPSAPATPDYRGAAVAQGEANKDAALASGSLSNPNINSPYGSQVVSYDQSGPNGEWKPTVTQSLNPQSQQIFDQQQQVKLGLAGLGNAALGTAQNVLGTSFDPNVPRVQTGLNTSGIARMPVNAGTTAQQAIMSRLQPQMDRRREQYINRLMSEGHVRGNEGYDNAMREYGQTENDMLLQAGKEGIGIDMGANQQGYNQALQSGQFSNTAQQQALAQAYQQRSQPINEIAALMSGSQIQNPQFQGYSGQTIGAAPIANAMGQQGVWNKGLYNSQVGQANAGNEGLFSLGAAALPLIFSDRRLKSNIVRIGMHPLGIGVYEYDIFGKRERGVMADEVEAVRPQAVSTHPSGFKMVRYDLL